MQDIINIQKKIKLKKISFLDKYNLNNKVSNKNKIIYYKMKSKTK